jgi:NADH dehydrogenase
LLGGGKTRFQPVYVGDVAAAIAAASAGKAKPRTIYELGGPDVVTFRQLLDLVQEWSGRRRWYLRIPFWMAQIVAFLTWPLPYGLRPLTVDQVRMLMRPNVVSEVAIKEGRTLQGLGIETPHAMAGIVPTYLERFQPHGQFAHYRS